jgi:hypothetical protein
LVAQEVAEDAARGVVGAAELLAEFADVVGHHRGLSKPPPFRGF